MNNAVVSHLSLQDLLLNISTHISRNVHHDLASVVLCDEATGQLRVHALDAPAPGGVLAEGSVLPMEGTPPGLAIKTRATVRRERIDLEEFHSPVMRLAYDAGLRSGCSVPLVSHDRVLGTINVGSLREAAFSEADAELLEQIAGQVAIAVENALNFEQRDEGEGARADPARSQQRHRHEPRLRDLLHATSACLRRYFRHDFAAHGALRCERPTASTSTPSTARVPARTSTRASLIPLEGTPLAWPSPRAARCSRPLGAWETSLADRRARVLRQQGLRSILLRAAHLARSRLGSSRREPAAGRDDSRGRRTIAAASATSSRSRSRTPRSTARSRG